MGFEPTTHGLKVRYSDQLSYASNFNVFGYKLYYTPSASNKSMLSFNLIASAALGCDLLTARCGIDVFIITGSVEVYSPNSAAFSSRYTVANVALAALVELYLAFAHLWTWLPASGSYHIKLLFAEIIGI